MCVCVSEEGGCGGGSLDPGPLSPGHLIQLLSLNILTSTFLTTSLVPFGLNFKYFLSIKTVLAGYNHITKFWDVFWPSSPQFFLCLTLLLVSVDCLCYALMTFRQTKQKCVLEVLEGVSNLALIKPAFASITFQDISAIVSFSTLSYVLWTWLQKKV